MSSALRGNLYTAILTRLNNLGHIVNQAEVWAVVDDVEAQILLDAQAQTDATTDNANFPVDPAQTT